jgi:hypothetical protein
MRNWFYISSLSFLSSFAWTQTQSKITRSELLIGEQTTIQYEFCVSNFSDSIYFQPKRPTITAFKTEGLGKSRTNKTVDLEIIGAFRDSIVYGTPNKWIGKYTLTSWDTGFFEIPAPYLRWKDSTIQFQPIRLHVIAPTLIAGKEIMESPIQFTDFKVDTWIWFKDNLGWIITCLALICSGLIYRKFRKKEKVVEVIPEIPLKDKTLLAIESLEQARLWEKDQLKDHYVEISYILRSYLGVRFELNLLESTSFQTRVLLKMKGVNPDLIQTTLDILEQADLVKFAKLVPKEIEILKVLALAKQVVIETSPLEFDVY